MNTTAMTTTTTVTFEKSIRYDRETGDFRATLDGNYIGHFASYYEAECALDQVAYDLLMDGQCATATELDGGSDSDTIAADVASGPACDALGCTSPAMHVYEDDTNGSWWYFCCGHYSDKLGRPACHCDALVIRAAEPAQLAARPAERQTCLLCGGDHPADQCPRIHPGMQCPCSGCEARRVVMLDAAAYVTYLRTEAGLPCEFCGEPHASDACPLRRPLIVPGPRVCGCCGGAHAIQRCGELRAALFMAA